MWYVVTYSKQTVINLSAVLLLKVHFCLTLILQMNNCDIFRISHFWNITYHDYENNNDYKILTIFDEKLMQQVIFDIN